MRRECNVNMNILWWVVNDSFWSPEISCINLLFNAWSASLQSNSKFALSVEPKNEELQEYDASTVDLRNKNTPTVI